MSEPILPQPLPILDSRPELHLIVGNCGITTPAVHQDPVVHPVTRDGRPRHYMCKVDGRWACACGHTE